MAFPRLWGDKGLQYVVSGAAANRACNSGVSYLKTACFCGKSPRAGTALGGIRARRPEMAAALSAEPQACRASPEKYRYFARGTRCLGEEEAGEGALATAEHVLRACEWVGTHESRLIFDLHAIE